METLIRIASAEPFPEAIIVDEFVVRREMYRSMGGPELAAQPNSAACDMQVPGERVSRLVHLC